MRTNPQHAIVYVSYHGTSQTRFDREHYVKHHLPLCMELWGQYGLEGVTAFFPALDDSDTIAICQCVFRDDAAIEAAFNSPELTDIMADVALCTDVVPVRMRATLL